MQNIILGVAIRNFDRSAESNGIAHISVIALAVGVGAVLEHFLIHSGSAVLFVDGHFLIGSADGADSTIAQRGNNQIPAEGQVGKGNSAAGSFLGTIVCNGIITCPLAGSICKVLNSGRIVILITIYPGNSAGCIVNL